MGLDKEKIRQVLLSHGLSTRRCERISTDLASRDLLKKKKELKSKILTEVIKKEVDER